ncbi:GGDEF domain-containing protein [Amphibacillus cookii]|uniref:GGDEF domain-containing protein n=1 Tax=Amphibacillus cookii TaxID=767787 RepID=UPI001956BDF2|nr:GGDEF domain-containing protein [Amphibacillus cookii]MBM7541247.1 diguanylate cyclase (GGDEF)-like protein [Amphibacillus cookii]
MNVIHSLLIIIVILIAIISQIYLNRNKYKKMALTDALTGVPNRYALKEYLRTSADKTEIVYFIDLDHFKSINDQYGHHYGDYVLKIIAARLALIQSIQIYRVGGDEFIIISNLPDKQTRQTLTFKLLESIKQPIYLNNHSLKVTATIGISEGHALKEDIIKEADKALLLAKKHAKGTTFCYSNNG